MCETQTDPLTHSHTRTHTHTRAQIFAMLSFTPHPHIRESFFKCSKPILLPKLFYHITLTFHSRTQFFATPLQPLSHFMAPWNASLHRICTWLPSMQFRTDISIFQPARNKDMHGALYSVNETHNVTCKHMDGIPPFTSYTLSFVMNTSTV